MQRTIFAAALVALAAMAATLALPVFAQGGPHWKLLTQTVPAGTSVQIRIQLVDPAGRPLPVKVSSVRVDMSPDNMAGMTAEAKILPTTGPDTVIVETNLYAPGRWAVILSATSKGKAIKGSVVVMARQKSAQAASPPPASPRKILYYRNPMGLADTSPVPKKDAMGMDYIPVYADQVTKVTGAVRLTTQKIQRTGVRTTAVMRMSLSREVRGSGVVAADENRQAVLTARFSGFIDRLFVSQTGDRVRAGEPLMRVWIESPEVLTQEASYIGALGSRSPRYAALAADVLRQYGVPQPELDRMARLGKPTRTITILAPATGTVMTKNAVDGMHFAAGDTLYQITDLSQVWVLADISERDLFAVKPGDAAAISFRDDPGASFAGKVLFVYPALDPTTRTAKVRIEVANPGEALRIGQYADVRIAAPVSAAPVLVIPRSAVIDDGTRQIAFVAKAGGLFEPRKLSLGPAAGQMVEVRSGLSPGERVVTAGNFLIDAESNLEAALQTFTPAAAQ